MKNKNIFRTELTISNGVYIADAESSFENQSQTNDAFSEKWGTYEQEKEDKENWKIDQFNWYLQLYGFSSEQELSQFLGKKSIILDAGCGLGYKAAWFARMNPGAIVIAMDYSNAIFQAQERYGYLSNMLFVKGDIANTPFQSNVFDFISCDQVLHHTESPPETLNEFRRILMNEGTLNTYVYSKKGLPRELLDDHFRNYAKSLSNEQIWELSKQLTILGKTLSELNISIEVPDIPALNIKGGEYDLQRFIYWNFIKCYWNENHGLNRSINCNFDWYSPSNAYRYTKDEFTSMLKKAGFESQFLHSEEACHTGRFRKCAE